MRFFVFLLALSIICFSVLAFCFSSNEAFVNISAFIVYFFTFVQIMALFENKPSVNTPLANVVYFILGFVLISQGKFALGSVFIIVNIVLFSRKVFKDEFLKQRKDNGNF